MAPKLSTLKRPASQTPKGKGKSLKRPAAAQEQEKVEPDPEMEEEEEQAEDPETEPTKLTKKALKDHNKFLEEAGSLDEANFLKALSKLEPKAAQKLWKKFQNSRKAEGQEEEYQEAMKHGAGSLDRKRKLLFNWVQSDKTCGDRYREYIQKISLVKTEGVKQKWLTSQQALATYGKEELWSRVKSGTILARRCPQDSRFWEFRSCQEMSRTEVTKAKETNVKAEGKMDKAMALEYHNMDWGALVEDDWEVTIGDEEAEEEDPTKELAKALGLRLPKEKESKDEKDKPGKQKEWELAKVSKDDTKETILDKIMKFKAEMEKDKSQLDSKEYQAKRSNVREPKLFKEKKEVTLQLEALTYMS